MHQLFTYPPQHKPSPDAKSGLELPFALVRGRSMSAAAWVEHRGIPLDCEFLELVRVHWEDIKRELVSQVNPQFGVYDEELSFRIDLF